MFLIPYAWQSELTSFTDAGWCAKTQVCNWLQLCQLLSGDSRDIVPCVKPVVAWQVQMFVEGVDRSVPGGDGASRFEGAGLKCSGPGCPIQETKAHATQTSPKSQTVVIVFDSDSWASYDLAFRIQGLGSAVSFAT